MGRTLKTYNQRLRAGFALALEEAKMRGMRETGISNADMVDMLHRWLPEPETALELELAKRRVTRLADLCKRSQP